MAKPRKGSGHEAEEGPKGWRRCMDIFDRKTYWGSLIFNLIAGILPALYITLSKLWVARIDSSHLATTDLYVHLQKITSILNDSLPRVAWLVIGDGTTRSLESRLELAYTLIGIQAILGLVLTVTFIGAAPLFAKSFLSADIWSTSVRYVQICAPVALSSLVKTATVESTRAMDQPDVSVMINIFGSFANILLDLVLISKFRVPWVTPSIHIQAGIQLVCEYLGALAGLLWFARNVRQLRTSRRVRVLPSWKALRVLIRPAAWLFLESLTRNAVGLWAVSHISTLSNAYVTAFGLFSSTIRWGLIMVPAGALYTSASTFVGHSWAEWRGRSGASDSHPTASHADIKGIVKFAVHSTIGALAVELVLCIGLTLGGIWNFAYFISNSEEVADIVYMYWRNVEWCYVIFAIGYQASSILLATVPKWFFYANLTSNVGWMLPWAAILATSHVQGDESWRLVTICFGGAVVVDSLSVGAFLFAWYWRLRKGKLYVTPVSADLRAPSEDRS